MKERQCHITCWPDVFAEIERRLRPRESRDAWLRRILNMPPRKDYRKGRAGRKRKVAVDK